MKEEATDYLEIDTLRNLIKKYSQFITFPIYLWSSKVRSQLSSSSVNSRRTPAFACRPNLCQSCIWLDYMSPVEKWSFSFQGNVYIISFVLFIFQFYICRYFHFLKTITLYFQIIVVWWTQTGSLVLLSWCDIWFEPIKSNCWQTSITPIAV